MLALALLSGALGVAGAQPTAQAVKATGPINIDGLLDEPPWAGAPWSSDFTVASVAGDEEPLSVAAVQTRFKVLVGPDSAYVAVECDEPEIDKVKAETPWRDGAVWADDCIEVFFDPGNDGRYYHQVMVNARGAIYDSFSADYGLVHSRLWNGAFEAAGSIVREARKWRVEVRIPFGAVVLGGSAGATWLWNVSRERHAGGDLELTSWAPLRRNFHQPTLFGHMAGLPSDYSAFRFRVDEPQVNVSRAGSGRATLDMTLSVANETGAACEVLPTAALLEDPGRRVQAEPLKLSAGEEATVRFPPLEFTGSAPNTNVVFALTHPDGRLIRAVVKQLSSEYRPIALTVLRPCYRDCIYATENLKAIEFQVSLSAQVTQGSREVRYRLSDEAGRAVAEGTVPLANLAKPVSIDAATLKEGRYVLSVRALGQGGAEQAATGTTLRKLPPPPAGNEVRIDENRNVLVNGKPIMPIGWYGSIPTEDPRADVVALQDIQTPVVLTVPDASPVRKAFQEHGTYSIVSVENGRLFYSFNLWQAGKEALRPIQDEYQRLDEPSEDVKRMARELVECARGEPGLLGYYIADEPEIHNCRSAYLEAYYRYLAEIDPYHPVFVTNDTIDGIVTHGYKCADVIDPDPYSPEWDYVPNFLKKVNEVASRGKATYVTLWHSTGQTHFNREMGSAPPYPYRVFRNQYFASIAYGAKGFTAYTSPFFMPEIEYRYGLPYVWRELRFLEPAILSPAPAEAPTVEGAPDLAAWAREVGGHVYLILVQHKPGEVDAKASWGPLKPLKRLTVMSEGREVAVTDGSFRDHFGEGDVHVYTDDPAARDFPKVESIVAELAQREKDAAKPGNLLHWTRGTLARCSEGYYAPWFEQYYYYAINGITDDLGWYASHAGGKPSWITFTLKEPAEIGRVVLYTPNISDYELEFTAPGGRACRASVTGNKDTVVTHNFRPAIACLKLRLTATAVRPTKDGPKAPVLSEIEAYAEPGEGAVTPVEVVEAPARPDVKALFGGEGRALWVDHFTDFQTAPKYNWDGKDTKWVKPDTFLAEPLPGGGVKVACAHAQGWDSMTHIFPYEPAFRFFQVKLSDLTGEGYKFTSVGFSNSSGKPGYRGALNTNRPGLYTVDTHYINEAYANGTDKTCFIVLSTAGSHKNPDDTVTPGPEFTFGWLRLVDLPLDGLIVTLADGAPLPESLKPGDTLHFEIHLQEPAQDATVEVLTGPNYSPLAINGEGYVQLFSVDDASRVWVGEVTLGPGTGKFKPEGYPVVFRANIVGGKLSETMASAFVEFE
jgi:hypothetical protein